MEFKFYYDVLGGHTHVQVFAGEKSLGKCGDLCFRNEEWEVFMEELLRSCEGMQFVGPNQ